MNSMSDVIDLHNSEGELSDTYVYIHLDETIFKLNSYTLVITSSNASKEEIKRWNDAINEEIRKDRNLMREIKEYRVLFRVLNRLRIKDGHIKKAERPDFIFKKKDKTYGIEITKIYTENDWTIEKMEEDVAHYNLEKEEIAGYMEYRKFSHKIKTYQMKDNIVFQPIQDEKNQNELQIKVKNKIFEKIRKMFDEYQSFDTNMIVASIVSPKYFQNTINLEEFRQELEYYVNHLEVDTSGKEYYLILILKNQFVQFDLSNHIYTLL